MGWLYYAWRSRIWSYFCTQGRRREFQNQSCSLPKVLLRLKVHRTQLRPQLVIKQLWDLHLHGLAARVFLRVALVSQQELGHAHSQTVFWAVLGPAEQRGWHNPFALSVACHSLLFEHLQGEGGWEEGWTSLNKSRHLIFSTWELFMNNHHIPVISKLQISWTKQ